MIRLTAKLIDTHCHLDLYTDVCAVIRQTEAAGVLTVAVTNTPSVFSHLVQLVGSAQWIRVALGLHPELAHERQRELPLFLDLIQTTRYVGEVGLDYSTPNEARRRVQRTVLGAIVDSCVRTGDKIVTVHSRRAADDVVDAFGAFRGTFILHWYSGSLRALQRALANGAYVSVNPAMVASEKSMKLMSHVPRDRVLTETDGPFVAVDNRPAHPSDVNHALRGLARLWQVDADSAKETVYKNFAHILRANSPTSG